MPIYEHKDYENSLIVKVIGLQWDVTDGLLKIKIDLKVTPTKRKLAKDISRFYNPHGNPSPIFIEAKVLLQQVWKLSVDWD